MPTAVRVLVARGQVADVMVLDTLDRAEQLSESAMNAIEPRFDGARPECVVSGEF